MNSAKLPNNASRCASQSWLATLLAAWMPAGCVSMAKRDLAQATDYAASTALAHAGFPAKAREVMPPQEAGGFVTTLEKGWLEVLAGQGNPEPLIALGENLEERKTIRVSHEASSYFYKETNDGYFPAEHEAVALHLVTGMSFLQQNNCPSALIEARRAARYLQSAFDDTQNHAFDDAGMRVWLSALWASCGEWESARVDLRRAASMNPQMDWAKRLAEQKDPPEHFVIVLGGTGPAISWNPSAEFNPLKGLSSIKFTPQLDTRLPLLLSGQALTPISTIGWYARHQERDYLIRDIMGNSKYAVDVSAATIAAGGISTIGLALGITVLVVGIGGGLYLAKVVLPLAEALKDIGWFVFIPSGAMIYGGLVLGSGIVRTSFETSGTIMDKAANVSEFYRYVRFLPEAIHGYGGPMLTIPETEEIAVLTSVRSDQSTVHILHHRGDIKHRINGAKRATWQDRTNHLDWVLVNTPIAFDKTTDTCKLLSRGYRVANWTDIQNGRIGGLDDPQVNREFAHALKTNEKVWSHETYKSKSKSRCKITYTKDMGESLAPDCTGLLPVLCVREAK